ncbi:MAG TPA: hypothetical protein VGL09_00570 [Methylomirabilota bacterium]|jgi:hypothetical protein
MVVREPDGSSTEYHEVPVAGDVVERLLTELFTAHWAALTVGPIIEGAAYEIRFSHAPKVTMLDGYLTVDTGPWHFHLCVNDHRGAPTDELAQRRRVARAAFYVTHGSGCVPGTWGLRLWNGAMEQMITVLFPNPYLDDDLRPLQPPRWERAALWEECRRRYAALTS